MSAGGRFAWESRSATARANVHIDEDVREEYWTVIRREPQSKARALA